MLRLMLCTALVLAGLAGLSAPALAQTYECTRTRLSSTGLRSNRVADLLFPSNMAIRVEGDTAVSAPYGPGSVTRAGDRMRFAFNVETTSGQVIPVRLSLNTKNNRYTVTVTAPSGFEQIAGAGGRCRVRS
ncbi:MAG: hypothetical protein AAFR47_04455 [Pseudomonadota bacterium]